MRIFLTLASLAVAFGTVSSAFAAGSTPSPGRMAIHVEHGAWESARVQDIEAVLVSVAEVLLPYFPRQASERVRVAFSKQGPRVLFEKSPDGAHLVLLNVKDTRWDQFAYQFSHELCHIFSNYGNRDISSDGAVGEHQWFEESLCEAVSIFALKRMASSWERSPPYPQWRDYAPAFGEYAERLLRERHRYLPPDKSIQAWYRENREELEANPYLREKNELLATWLLSLIEKAPGNLGAIAYLNLERSSSPESFEAYLESWYSCCPEGYRDFIRELISLFGERGHDRSSAVALAAPGGSERLSTREAP